MGASLGGMGGGGKKKETSTPSINITPLVDVVLVVLIIFMIVTPMVTKTFWLNLPPKDKNEQPPLPSDNKPLVLTVDKGRSHSRQRDRDREGRGARPRTAHAGRQGPKGPLLRRG